MPKSAEQRLDSVKTKMTKDNPGQVNTGGDFFHLETVPSWSLMFDYKSGIGGLPYGHMVEMFGENGLGKSALAYIMLGNVQRQGKVPVVLASEPRLVTPQDKAWALKLGFDPDQALILYPDNAEDAFDQLRNLIFTHGELVDYILVDSLGGMGTQAGTKDGGIKKAYGISGVVTAGLNDIMPRMWRNNIGMMILNQRRQTGAYQGNNIYDSPGGEALKHHASMRLYLKPIKPFNGKIEGEDALVGRELTVKFAKNNKAKRRDSANWRFFHIDTDKYGFGIDKGFDIINVGKLSGVIQGSGYYEHESFPKQKNGKHQIQGGDAVAEYLEANPEAMAHVRQDVMDVMIKQNIEAAAAEDTAQEVDITDDE